MPLDLIEKLLKGNIVEIGACVRTTDDRYCQASEFKNLLVTGGGPEELCVLAEPLGKTDWHLHWHLARRRNPVGE